MEVLSCLGFISTTGDLAPGALAQDGDFYVDFDDLHVAKVSEL